MQQEIFDLTDEVLRVPVVSFVGDFKRDWDRIAFLHLLRAHQSLGAIRMTLAENWYAPSVVLVRYLFELAINLMYLDKDMDNRVPKYLEHSRAALNLEHVEDVESQLDELWEKGDHAGVAKLLLPSTAWKPLKQMCEDMGLLDHYYTMYRLASEAAHGGAHGMATELSEHKDIEQRPQWEVPGALVTALTYYRWVVEVTCKALPDLAANYQFGATWGDRIQTIQDHLSQQIKRES